MKNRTIKILGYEYSLHFSPPVPEGGMSEAGRACIGKQVIIIDPLQCKQAQESSVLHEMIEALNYHLDLKLQHETIMQLEAGLYQCLKDNGVDLSSLVKG